MKANSFILNSYLLILLAIMIGVSIQSCGSKGEKDKTSDESSKTTDKDLCFDAQDYALGEIDKSYPSYVGNRPWSVNGCERISDGTFIVNLVNRSPERNGDEVQFEIGYDGNSFYSKDGSLEQLCAEIKAQYDF